MPRLKYVIRTPVYISVVRIMEGTIEGPPASCSLKRFEEMCPETIELAGKDGKVIHSTEAHI